MKIDLIRRLPSCVSALLVCLLFTAAVSAQYKDWRPVSPEDVASKTPVVEPDADAEAMFWEMRIDDSSSDDLDMWHYVRVKIFTERGREKYSKFDIPYLKGTKIKDLAARVIKTDGSTVDIGSKDIFDREIVRASGVKMMAKSFAVPNIEPGVIVEYKYKEAQDDSGASGMRLPLQRDIPVRLLSYYYKPYQKEPQYQAYNTKDFKFIKDEKGFFLGEIRNVAAFKEEPRMPPEDQVRPWLLLTSSRFQITSASAFSISFVVKDPGNPQSYWAAVASEKGQTVKWLTKKDKKLKTAAEEIAAGATTQEEKLRKLYDFTQRQIHNVTYDPKITDEQRRKLPAVKNIADVLERKQAPNPSYVNWLFASLANALGIEVRLAYAGSRNQMFFNPNMTNERLLFSAGVAIMENGKPRIYNPSQPFLPFGTQPWYQEDSYTLLVGADNYMWAESPSLKHDENKSKRIGKFRLSDDGTLEGDVTVEMYGQPAFAFRQTYWDETPDKQSDSIIETVKGRMSTAEVTSVSVENMNDPSKPLVQRYKVKVPNYAQKTGKRLFIQPSVFQHGPSAMFSSASRKYDIFFRYPWSETDSIEIQLPNGFELDSADAPAPFSDANKIGSLNLDIKIDKSRNALLVDREFFFGANGNILFGVKTYEPLKNVFDQFHKSDSHTITLRQN
jgi:hypothetical protein